MKNNNKEKKVYKFASIVLNIFLTISTIILIVLIYNYVQTKILKKDYCNFLGYTAFKVVSGSMADTINIGDIVIVKIEKNYVERVENINIKIEKNKENININDIIVFKQDEYIITHRVIKIDRDKILTKGDANNTEDKTIERSQIIGKVTKVFPNINTWKKVFTSPTVLTSIIITVILFAIAFSVEDNNLRDDIK